MAKERESFGHKERPKHEREADEIFRPYFQELERYGRPTLRVIREADEVRINHLEQIKREGSHEDKWKSTKKLMITAGVTLAIGTAIGLKVSKVLLERSKKDDSF